MEISPELISGTLVALVGGGGLWTYLGAKRSDKTDLIQIAQDAAKEVISNLREEVDRQDRRLAEQDARIVAQGARIVELEAQDARCRADLAETRRELASVRDQLNLLI